MAMDLDLDLDLDMDMEAAENENQRVCVTGAGGFVASWLVNLLLSNDYTVHGTVRNPQDTKNTDLYKLPKASQNLKLFKTDLLDYHSLRHAIAGCRGVFHVASPLPSSTMKDPETEMMEAAVKGIINVLKACVEAQVKRVVVVSSVAAVIMNPNWPKGQVKDETCWSDKEYLKSIQAWYHLSKTEAETVALEFAKTNGLDVVTVCPTLVLGPILQSTLGSTALQFFSLLKGEYKAYQFMYWLVVDVRDVAEALLMAYKKPEAEGRYICTSHSIWVDDLVDKLKNIYPNYNYPKHLSRGDGEEDKLSSEKLKRLGWSFRPLEETIVDAVESYRKAGLMD